MIKIAEYKELILAKEFFKAHEVLEEFWFPRRKQKDELTLIVKGFINAAVAFELKKRGKEQRALQVWQTYKKFAKKIDSSKKDDFYHLALFIDSYASKYLL